MKSISVNDDVLIITDKDNDGCHIYGSIRDLYSAVYHKSMQYKAEENSAKKDELAKELEVLRKTLISLSETSDYAATIADKKEDILSRLDLMLIPACILINILLTLFLNTIL